MEIIFPQKVDRRLYSYRRGRWEARDTKRVEVCHGFQVACLGLGLAASRTGGWKSNLGFLELVLGALFVHFGVMYVWDFLVSALGCRRQDLLYKYRAVRPLA